MDIEMQYDDKDDRDHRDDEDNEDNNYNGRAMVAFGKPFARSTADTDVSHQNKNKNKTTKALRKITIVAIGTRGDLQPLVAIGVALKKHLLLEQQQQHQCCGEEQDEEEGDEDDDVQIRVLTHTSTTHVQLVENSGLIHVPFCGDSEKRLQIDINFQKSMRTGKSQHLFKAFETNFHNQVSTFCNEFLNEIHNHPPDLLLLNVFTDFFGWYTTFAHRQEQPPIPCVVIHTHYSCINDPNRSPWGGMVLPCGLHISLIKSILLPAIYDKLIEFDHVLADKSKSSGGGCGQQQQQQPFLADVLSKEEFLQVAGDQSKILLPGRTLLCQSPLFRDILYPTGIPQNMPSIGDAVLHHTDNNNTLPQPSSSAAASSATTSLEGKSGDGSGDDCRLSSSSSSSCQQRQQQQQQQQPEQEQFGGQSVKNAIEDFIKADPNRKPIYLGWGSMISKSSAYMTQFAIQTLMICNQRGIILGGWARLGLDALEEVDEDEHDDVNTCCFGSLSAHHHHHHHNNNNNNSNNSHRKFNKKEMIQYAQNNILFVEKVSHEWLFPKVAAAVHHGGAGTAVASMRAGIPTIITPVFMDQWDHAYLVNQLNVGIGFTTKQLQSITPQELSHAIQTVLLVGIVHDDGSTTTTSSSSQIQINAKEIGRKLQKEDGTTAVVKEIEIFWNDEVQTGTFLDQIQKRYDEAKAYREGYATKKKQKQRIRCYYAVLMILLGVLVVVAVTFSLLH